MQRALLKQVVYWPGKILGDITSTLILREYNW